EAVLLVAHHDRRAVDAQRRLLQERAVAEQAQQRLGMILPRQRPEPGAGTAGEDDGLDIDGGHYRTAESTLRQSGSAPSSAAALRLSSTEFAGRRAGVGYSRVAIGTIAALSPRMARAKPYQVVSPEGTRWNNPSTPRSINEIVFSARKRLE